MALKSFRSRPFLLLLVTLVISITLLPLLAFHFDFYETILYPVCADYALLHEPTDCSTDKPREKEQPNDHHYSTTLFEPHPILENLSSSGDEAWAQNLLTPKGGFLLVQLNSTANQAWGISMFHALHCLQTLRQTI